MCIDDSHACTACFSRSSQSYHTHRCYHCLASITLYICFSPLLFYPIPPYLRCSIMYVGLHHHPVQYCHPPHTYMGPGSK